MVIDGEAVREAMAASSIYIHVGGAVSTWMDLLVFEINTCS
jgi:hypothetical protein